MNLTLRRATKAEIITRRQHDAIVRLMPKASEADGLDPESAHHLETWLSFGDPIAVGMMGAMDLRAMQSPMREEFLRREVEPDGDWMGYTPDHFRMIWRELDNFRAKQAAEAMKAGSDG